nr:putative integron gene cassette protein [uncultured bacterium]
MCSSGTGDDPDRDLGLTKFGGFRGDDHVTRQSDLASAG